MGCLISANLIALNEQHNIAAAIRSLDWADEVVLLDGGSKDGTAEIARRLGARVYVHPFDDYSRQRNRALDLSRGDWIFSLDADERVSPPLSQEVRSAVAWAGPSLQGFWVPIRSHIFGRRFRFTGTQGERKMRLFRRQSGRWTGAVHETVSLRGPAGLLKHALDHWSTPDLESYLAKLDRYTRLELGGREQAGGVPGWCRVRFEPFWVFCKLYLAKLGLLDGPEGFCFAALSAWGLWVRHCVQREGSWGNQAPPLVRIHRRAWRAQEGTA